MPIPSDQIEVAVLADNQAPEPLRSEHGLAILITASGKRILFDTGQGETLAMNAAALGVDISIVDAIVLSHGHYDHTGGLSFVLPQARTAEIYLHPSAFLERYSLKPANFAKPVHMQEAARLALQNHPKNKIHAVSSPMEIYPGVSITGPIPRKTDYEDTGGKFYLDPECTKPDNIEDDQALWLETEQGLIIIAGCCHSGLVNTIAYIYAQSSQKRIYAIIGGFHLLNADERRMKMTIEYLQSLKLGRLYPCHCTGEKAVEELKHILGEMVGDCLAGMNLGIV